MKKFIKTCALLLTIAISAGVFVACGNEPETLTSNMVSLSYTSIQYDGTEKKPDVTITVNEEVVDSEEYTVEYTDNKLAGNAVVKVTANEDSKYISGSVSVGFVITPAEVSASSLTDLEALIENENIDSANLTSALNIETGKTFTIPEGFSVNMGDNQLTINSGAKIKLNGTLTASKPIINNGSIEGEGEYVSYVASHAELTSSLKDADKIVLENDILSTDGGDVLNIYAEYTKSGIEIDLNGKTISKRVSVRNTTFKNFNITIRNGKIIGAETGDNGYALTIFNKAASADKYVVVLEDLVATSGQSGISTNGKAEHTNATIIAKNCTFGSRAGEYGLANGSAVGVFLPAKYVYKFENCTFYGLTGYYTKSGDHTLTNCTVNGLQADYKDPTHKSSGASETGSGLVADSASGYQTPLKLTIKGGTFISVAGHAIEEIVTTNTGVQKDYTTLTIKGNPVLQAAAGKQDKVIITNEK